jgi:hypothetical protein
LKEVNKTRLDVAACAIRNSQAEKYAESSLPHVISSAFCSTPFEFKLERIELKLFKAIPTRISLNPGENGFSKREVIECRQRW